jgi:protein gp37
LLERINLSGWLTPVIEEVTVGGESGNNARVCDYDWVLDIRNQCIEKNIPFYFKQTGARFVKDGHLYRIKRQDQHSQAKKAGIDFEI